MLQDRGTFIGTIPEGKKIICEGKVITPDKEEITLEGTYLDKGLKFKEGYKKGYILQRLATPNWHLCEVKGEKVGNFEKLIIDTICEVEV